MSQYFSLELKVTSTANIELKFQLVFPLMFGVVNIDSTLFIVFSRKEKSVVAQ